MFIDFLLDYDFNDLLEYIILFIEFLELYILPILEFILELD